MCRCFSAAPVSEMTDTPDPTAVRLAARAVAARLASGARIELVDRQSDAALRAVVTEAEEMLGRSTVVFLVDDGAPELFTVRGLPLVPVSFSARYVDLAFAVREILSTSQLSELREDLAASLAFRTMSEVLMRQQSWDLAVYTFLAGVFGSVSVDVGAFVNRMPDVPRDEAHLTALFFGLLHEFGHGAQPELTDRLGPPGYLADDTMTDWLDTLLRTELGFPAESVPELLVEASTVPTHPLNLERLRDEIRADLFAATALVRASHQIMADAGNSFRLARFAPEPTTALTALWFLTVCRGLARYISVGASTRDDVMRLFLHQATLSVRVNYIHQYLGWWSPHWPNEPDDGRASVHLLDQASAQLAEPMRQLDSGLSRAIRFALFPEERAPARELLARFAAESEANAWYRHEAGRICRLADASNAPQEHIALKILRTISVGD
jgi:hypothetical protein